MSPISTWLGICWTNEWTAVVLNFGHLWMLLWMQRLFQAVEPGLPVEDRKTTVKCTRATVCLLRLGPTLLWWSDLCWSKEGCYLQGRKMLLLKKSVPNVSWCYSLDNWKYSAAALEDHGSFLKEMEGLKVKAHGLSFFSWIFSISAAISFTIIAMARLPWGKPLEGPVLLTVLGTKHLTEAI